MTDDELFDRVREVLRMGWIEIPGERGYGGAGGPGRVLEELLDAEGGNLDIPDAGKWELKFHSGNTLLTLFHKEAQPKGHLDRLVHRFGWEDAQGRLSFRHTIHGRSSDATGLGFYVANESGRITVRDDSVSDIIWPYWTHDTLINAFASKFRRLIVVKGSKRNNGAEVRYESAHTYEEPQTTLLIEAIARGVIALDFDARTRNGDGLRNHGTKFRIHYDDLRHLYHRRRPL